MYGDRVGKFQFFQLLKRILCPSAILEFHLCSFRKFIDRSQNSGITIKNTNPFFDWNAISAPDLPLHLIIIADLHDFVALTQKPMHTFSFFLSRIRRIQISLQNLVQAFHTKKALPHRSQNLNFKWFMQTLLDRKDRMSMYSGLEVRVPFCDYRIAEYLYSVPWEFKDYHGQEKGLLREAMRGVLPDEVLWRRKSPYPKTWNPSYLAAVSAELRTVLNEPAAPLLRIIRADALETLLASGADNPIPWYGQLMTTPQTIAWFLQLNYWLAKYKVELV